MVKQHIIPMLMYDDIEAIQRFQVEAFGFERGVLERAPNCSVVHAEVSIGDSVIWLLALLLNMDWLRRDLFQPYQEVSLS